MFELTLYETYSLIASPGTEGLSLLQGDYDLCRDVSLALIEDLLADRPGMALADKQRQKIRWYSR
jgi:hypothetical protein